MKRFQNPGRVTNYEMTWLREHPRRNRRWLRLWASVSQPFHATSLTQWRQYQGEDDSEEHRQETV